MSTVYITIYSILSYMIIFGGIFLVKFFTDKFEWRKPYKFAILVIGINFLIMFLVGYLLGLPTAFLHDIGADMDLIILSGYTLTGISLFLNLLILTLLIHFFYKNGFKDSIFIALAIISIQVFIRIVVANVLSIIFSITTGGYLILYPFQFI